MSRIIKGYQSEGIKSISIKELWGNEINEGEQLNNSSPSLSQSQDGNLKEINQQEIKEITNNILEEARKEAKGIVEQAKVDAQILMEEAIKLGDKIEEEHIIQKEELQREHNEIIQSAEEKATEILKKATEEREQILKAAHEEKQKLLESIELETAKTISKIVEHIVGNEIYENTNWIRCFVKKVLRNENIIEDIKVIVSEKNYKALQGSMSSRIGQRNIFIESSEDIADDICIVETSNGSIEYNISNTLDQVLNEIMAYQDI